MFFLAEKFLFLFSVVGEERGKFMMSRHIGLIKDWAQLGQDVVGAHKSLVALLIVFV